MDINIPTKKKKAIKKLLNINDTKLKETIEKILEDWANNVISTKYQSHKSIDQIVDELQ